MEVILEFLREGVLSFEGFLNQGLKVKGFSQAPVSDLCIMASAQKLPRFAG
ncbi:hypothetical protein LINPERPRIM_LOCUS2403 [Linum perenne]